MPRVSLRVHALPFPRNLKVGASEPRTFFELEFRVEVTCAVLRALCTGIGDRNAFMAYLYLVYSNSKFKLSQTQMTKKPMPWIEVHTHAPARIYTYGN